jgi:hypothetical protein
MYKKMDQALTFFVARPGGFEPPLARVHTPAVLPLDHERIVTRDGFEPPYTDLSDKSITISTSPHSEADPTQHVI